MECVQQSTWWQRHAHAQYSRGPVGPKRAVCHKVSAQLATLSSNTLYKRPPSTLLPVLKKQLNPTKKESWFVNKKSPWSCV